MTSNLFQRLLVLHLTLRRPCWDRYVHLAIGWMCLYLGGLPHMHLPGRSHCPPVGTATFPAVGIYVYYLISTLPHLVKWLLICQL